MTTALEKVVRREVAIGKDPYTLTLSPEGFKLVPKGKRNGVELAWTDLVSGQAALAVGLNASLMQSAAARAGNRQPKTRAQLTRNRKRRS